ICGDKSATSDLLRFNNVPAVQHTFFISPIHLKFVGGDGNWARLTTMLTEHGRLVCKPNDGTGGESVYLVTNQIELEQAAHNIGSRYRGMAVSPYYRIENEFRVIVLHNTVKLIYSKNIPFVGGDGESTLGQLVIAYLQAHPDVGLDLEQFEGDRSLVLKKG